LQNCLEKAIVCSGSTTVSVRPITTNAGVRMFLGTEKPTFGMMNDENVNRNSLYKSKVSDLHLQYVHEIGRTTEGA